MPLPCGHGKGDSSLLTGTERKAKNTICPLKLHRINGLAEAGLCVFQIIGIAGVRAE